MAKARPKLSTIMQGDIQGSGSSTWPQGPSPDPSRGEDAATPTPGRRASPASKRNKWVQLNVFVPGELRDTLKLEAFTLKKDMSDLVVEALQAYLKQVGK